MGVVATDEDEEVAPPGAQGDLCIRCFHPASNHARWCAYSPEWVSVEREEAERARRAALDQ